MAEYIYTNLPQYVKVTPRTDFSSSVVSSGAVLLFSEDGSSLTAKLPDGSFVNVGGGSGGTDVSPTTAEAGDVLSGKIFFTSGGIQTSGTIPTVSASLAANVTTVPSGYIASAQTLTVPLASSATVVGGIVTIPAGYVASDYTVSVGGGGSTDYFKCATVTSGGSTWTGYKAVFASGSYGYESAVTSGLTYTTVTPLVGAVYADGALVRATLYEGWEAPAGALFYASLSAQSATAETGQTLTGSPNAYMVKLGIPCAQFIEAANLMTAPDTGLPTGNSPNTVCGWICFDDLPNNWTWGIGYGTRPQYMKGRTGFAVNDGNHLFTGSFGLNIESSDTITTNTWYFVASTYDGDNITLWVNAVKKADQSVGSFDVTLDKIQIGIDLDDVTGYLAGLRIYDRVLTSAEIAQLYAEFTPSAS